MKSSVPSSTSFRHVVRQGKCGALQGARRPGTTEAVPDDSCRLRPEVPCSALGPFLRGCIRLQCIEKNTSQRDYHEPPTGSGDFQTDRGKGRDHRRPHCETCSVHDSRGTHCLIDPFDLRQGPFPRRIINVTRRPAAFVTGGGGLLHGKRAGG